MNAGADEKPPVLRVKKGAQVLDEGLPLEEPPLSPLERLAARDAPGGRGQRRPGRLGRLSTVFALVLAGLALLFILRAQPRVSNTAFVSGYSVELRAQVVEGFLAASLTIVGPRPATVQTVTARFSLPDTDEEAVAEEQLSSVTVLGARLPFKGTESKVEATIRIGGEQKQLALGFKGRAGKP